MISVTKEQTPDGIVLKLSGSVEENVEFDKAIGVLPPGNVFIHTKDVTRINSVGVKAWIKYFTGIVNKGAKLKFIECSTAIVEQINLISNFTCGGEVISIYAPYSCPSDGSELVALFKIEDLKKLNLKFPPLKSPKTGAEAVFDDIADEYLAFLMRSGS